MKTLLAAVVALTALSGAARAQSSDVTIDKGALHGTLLMPDGAGNVPAVLMIAGSGPTDRDGNSTVPGVRPATLKLLAEGLAKQGIASLRFDKRGIAASAGAMPSEKDLRFSTYVDDAVGWTNFLRSQKRVSCVVIFGHSEGALIGALAAAKTNVCGYISASGVGEPTGDILEKQLAAAHKAGHLPEPLWSDAKNILAKLESGETTSDVPTPLMSLFRPSVQPYEISHFAVDPRKAIAALRMPVLILQGTHDIQVGVDDAKALAAADPRAQLVLLDGVSHILKDAPAARRANVATYRNPDLPLAPKLVPTVAAFVERCARSIHE